MALSGAPGIAVSWTYIASWTQDVAMSTDSSEGHITWNLKLN
jgi:hypothetical protein